MNLFMFSMQTLHNNSNLNPPMNAEAVPQGLKPALAGASNCTPKAVPFPGYGTTGSKTAKPKASH